MSVSRIARLGAGLVAVLWALGSCGSKGLTGIDPILDGCELTSEIFASNAKVAAWDRTGQRIAFENALDEHGVFGPGIYLADVRSGHGTRIVGKDTLGWYGASCLSWAPNDDRLLMWLQGRICIVDPNTGEWRYITDGARDVTLPSWSPSGDSILFFRGYLSHSEKLTAGGLYVRNLRTGVQCRFVARDSAVTLPWDRCLYSPDGRWIVYTVDAPAPGGLPSGTYEIEIVRSDGGERRRLTHLQGQARRPQWVSDDEIEFDFVPYGCMGIDQTPVAHTMSVRIDGTLLGRWEHDLVDSRTQFSEEPAIDWRRNRAAVVWHDPETGHGELFVRPLRGGSMHRVFRYDRKPDARGASPWRTATRRP